MKRLVYIVALLAATRGLAIADDDDLDVSATPPPPVPAVVPVAVAPTPPPEPVVPPVSPAGAATARAESLFDGLVIGGYVQGQAQVDQQSEDQLAQGGAELNKDNFVVRRARLSVSRAWTYSALALELDANTVRGATVGLRRAEAILIVPHRGEQPYASFAIGLTDIPFGYELQQSSRERLFAERTTASLALFPGEPDVGARAWGAYDIFRWSVAAEAGEPINERAGFNRPDPNQAKDFLGRVGIDANASECVTIAGGVSFLVGRGFHAGTDATKDAIEWHDLNEDGAIQVGELSSVPGQAAIPSANFDRWAFGADVEIGVHWRAGWLRVQGEVVVASNLDRGLFVADPVASGIDTRELGANVAAVQDVGSFYGGARLDYYDPNLDAFDSRGGVLIPADETILTISPLFGVRLPHGVRASVQYDYVVDHEARDGRGVPSDLANDRLTARLQVEL